MQERPRCWLWPNIVGIDAAVIAVVWQWIFAASIHDTISLSAQLVLGLSVWLSYMADRLYDVRSRPIEQLLSLRHRFAKRHRKQLWGTWLIVLALNIGIALTGLTAEQLIDGALLLSVCLLYTLLNQLYSKRFFPKELFVALIFTGGAVVFIESIPNLFALYSFAVICLVNCLILGHKEQVVDIALRVQSLTSMIGKRALCVWILTAIAPLPWLEGTVCWSLSLTLLATCLLYRFRQQIGSESFRAALDASMLIGLLPYAIAAIIA